jgi:RNA polymerase II subunit A-like phosphatase
MADEFQHVRVLKSKHIQATIVDDREDVWANATNNSTGRPGEPPDNLLLVRPYHWKNFLGYADVNNASGVDISSTEDSTKQQESSAMQKKNAPETEGDNERQLLWTADILKRLHARYYSEQLSDIERDSLTVPGILKQMRREVLGSSVAAARLVFSGLIPIHKQQHSSDGPKKPRFSVTRYAEELGAMVRCYFCLSLFTRG